MSEHKWTVFVTCEWCESCGALRMGGEFGDYFVVGQGCVGTDAPPCRAGSMLGQERATGPMFNVVVDVPPGQVHIKNVVHETLHRRAELIDIMALRYGLGFQLVERRDGMTTTWTIEPACETCLHNDGTGQCSRLKAPTRNPPPDDCPRRRPA